MALEPIGALFVLVSLACLVYGESVSVFALLASTLLGAAAAMFLTVVNHANVQPAHMLLMFIAAGMALRPAMAANALRTIAFPRAGFWLALTVSYGALITVFMPRLFAGSFHVFNLAQQGSGGAGIMLVPLSPVSANVTQTVYFAGDLVCFVIFCAYAHDTTRLQFIAKAVIACAFLNVGFAVLDVATYFTGTADLLSFFRNTSYRMLDDIELAGFKRIVGSFTEASTFAYATLALFAFTFKLWLRGAFQAWAGVAAGLSFIALMLSTSSAGYFGTGCFLAFQYLQSAGQMLSRRATPNSAIFLVTVPLLMGVLALFLLMHSEARATLERLIDITLFSKMDSQSGVERASWNRQALDAFWQTNGFGAGIGSVRASSWLIAVIASIGAVGALTYGMFTLAMLVQRNERASALDEAIQSAARAACLAQIFASAVAVSFIDLGLLFFALAGVACGAQTQPRRAFPPAFRSCRLAFPGRSIASPATDGAPAHAARGL